MTLATFQFTDRARPIVELGVGDTRIAVGTAVWDTARWDATPNSVWAGTEPSWHDITCETYRYRCEYGRKRTTERFVPGVATVIVNNATGWADPNVVGDTNVLTVRPGRAIRMGVVHQVFGVQWLFRGFVDAVIPTYDPAAADTVQLDCIDALGEVNRAKFVAGDLAPAGETVNNRVARVLDLAQWPVTKRDLQPTSDTLIADDMGGQAADLLGQAADSNGGVVFGDLEARVAYRPRDWQTFPPGTPVDGTIGNVESTDVCPTKWERPFARADIATRVIVGREAPPAQGAPGAPGAPGISGPMGPQGPAGPKGDPGQGFTYTQETAPTGALDGETWWNTATGVSYLYWHDGTSAQWVQFAPGADGVPGPAGPAGPTGPASTMPGPAGPAGATGTQGPQGLKGDTGAAGATGPAGADSIVPGPAGPAGATGAAGPKGDPGATGATGATGPAGAASTVPGPTGPAGATGVQGPAGAKGDKGDPGATGAAGTAGAQGPQGVKGDPGATGAAGPTGPASTVPGPAGPAGAAGAQGPKGDTGTAGATGAQGPKGDTGAQGIQGVQGPTGPAGAAGSGYTFKQDTTPTPTAAGQTWWNSSTGALSGTTWVAVDRGGGVLVWVQDN